MTYHYCVHLFIYNLSTRKYWKTQETGKILKGIQIYNLILDLHEFRTLNIFFSSFLSFSLNFKKWRFFLVIIDYYYYIVLLRYITVTDVRFFKIYKISQKCHWYLSHDIRKKTTTSLRVFPIRWTGSGTSTFTGRRPESHLSLNPETNPPVSTPTGSGVRLEVEGRRVEVNWEGRGGGSVRCLFDLEIYWTK